MGPRLKPVNLISRGQPKRQKKDLFQFMILGALIIFIFVAIPASIVTSYRIKTARIKRTIEDTKIKFKKTQSQNFQSEKTKSDLTKEENLLKQRLDLLTSTELRGFGYSAVLLAIPELLPLDLWITHLVMNDNEIQISGATVSSQFIADFIGKLDGCKDFRNTRFVSTEKQVTESHTIYNFQVAAEPSWSQSRTLTVDSKSKANLGKKE